MHNYPGVSFSNTIDRSFYWLDACNLKYRSKKNRWHTFRYTIFERINNGLRLFYFILHSRLINKINIININKKQFQQKHENNLPCTLLGSKNVDANSIMCCLVKLVALRKKYFLSSDRSDLLPFYWKNKRQWSTSNYK